MLKTMRPIFIFAMYLTSFYIDYAVNGTDFINNTDKFISAADFKGSGQSGHTLLIGSGIHGKDINCLLYTSRCV